VPGDRIALVTGAASGIGARIAAALHMDGWRVAGLDLRPSGTALALEADVADADAVADAVARAERELGPLRLAVTAAGIYEMAAVDAIDPVAWERMLRVNLAGTVNVCAAVLPGMVAARRGAVVTISSDLGLGGSADDAHYATSKGAVLGLTRALAREVAPHGVLVNSVAPGATNTAMIGPDSPWRARPFLDTLPLRRLVEPEEIAAAVRFLAGGDTRMNGQVISPNAGAVI
jgi:NAD(P)-dependent dehydrogenase (short-subunit alcohol dehydrogenase family)